MSPASPFSYTQKELQECLEGTLGKRFEENPSCRSLFDRYAAHYHRCTLPENYAAASDDVKQRFLSFIDSVIYVQAHNGDESASHHVTLNTFADRPLDAVLEERGLLMDDDSRRLIDDEEYNDAVGDWNDVAEESYVRLNSAEIVYEVAADLLGIGKGSMNRLQPKHQEFIKHKQLPATNIDVPVAGEQEPFETPLVDQVGLDGLILKVKKRKNFDPHAPSKADKLPSEPAVDKAFETYLDWATDHNPDGVSIVHPAIDQGKCGSCWAKAATGSLEASAGRREAYFTYKNYRASHEDGDNVDPQAIAAAQEAEGNAMDLLRLSIQELLDCDIAADQGCTGGNPLLAFYFIHRYGLTSDDAYPYVGHEQTCQDKLVRRPVASVKSWGILPPDHEDHIELVLRYIGPIAVGVNAAERSFLSYSGGIYHPREHCHQSANHALLITGYGQKVHHNGNVTKYFIARNTWGQGWGENGFVRIQRGDGQKGTPGVCGIARSPSVALGGLLLKHKGGLLREFEGSEFQDRFPAQNLCAHMGYTPGSLCGRAAIWIDYHKALFLAMLAIFCGIFILWPLTTDIRRRRRRRRERMLAREAERRLGNAEESTSLTNVNKNGAQYGST